ncbi:glycosyltransferase 61 family protein [Plastorhodobacter daqingensis]|uniref:Glycosyltransferase 61 family protein n=1 Tax=Plastorhodobacter daqingensis TaxID=1387281 RepID=A0ABW2UJ95_9RHOB
MSDGAAPPAPAAPDQRIEAALAAGNPALALEILFSAAFAAARAGTGSAALELPALEAACTQFLAAAAPQHPLPAPHAGFDRPTNLYIVTEIYQAGGHRALLEALIAARPQDRHLVLFTMTIDRQRAFSLQRMADLGVLALAPDPGTGLYDSWLWLRNKLAALAARRVFLLHHPEDVVAALAAREVAPRLGPRLYVIRHADTVASLGTGLDGATQVAIRPEQKARLIAQEPGRRVALLPLVPPAPLPKRALPLIAPAPAPPPPAPLPPGRRARLRRALRQLATLPARVTLPALAGLRPPAAAVTATCGTEHKFLRDGPLGFPAALVALLQATGGRHLHIGPTSETFRAAAHAALDAAGINRERLLLAGEVGSVADCLRSHRVQLYLGSFPVAGALSLYEAIGAGIPVALRTPAPGADATERYLAGTGLLPPGLPHWTTVADLAQLAGALPVRDPARQAALRAAQGWLRRRHSPERMRRRLDALIAATEGRTRAGLSAPDAREAIAPLFDAAAYLKRNPDVAAAGLDPLDHYLRHGAAEGRPAHPLFDAGWYLARLPEGERRRASATPLAHYLLRGEAAGHAPHPLFDPALAAQGLPGDLPGASVLERYLRSDGMARPHSLFDPDHYLRQLPLAPQGQTPLEHFLTQGAELGLSPHPAIDLTRLWQQAGSPPGAGLLRSFLDWLARKGPDAAEPSPHPLFAAGHLLANAPQLDVPCLPNALWTYLVAGNSAAAAPHPLVLPAHVDRMRPGTLTEAEPLLVPLAQNRLGVDTHPLLSNAHVQAQAPWLAQGSQSATEFFALNGRTLQIDPHPWFSSKHYLHQNPDVAAAGVNPLLHYLQHGETEGRNPHPFFNARHYRAAHRGAETRPFQHYLCCGVVSALPVTPQDGGIRRLGRSAAATALATPGLAPARAAALLAEALHPPGAPVHPTLTTEARPLALEPPQGRGPRHSLVPVPQPVLRPRLLGPGPHHPPLTPPAGHCAPPDVTLETHADALVVGGADGFVPDGADGPWYDPGLAGFDPAIAQLKALGPVEAVRMPQGAEPGAVLLRRHGPEQAIATGIFACGSYSNNYFHFLVEVLPRALLAADGAPPGTPILTDAGMPAQHYQALRLYLPQNPILQLDRHRSYRVGRLYAAGMPNIIHDAFGATEGRLDTIRYSPDLLARLAAPAAALRDGGTPRRLFLWRDSPVRRLLSAEELANELAGRGVVKVNFAQMPFAEQIRHMANAEIIVGQSGAHFANLLFAAPGARILALFSNAPGTPYGLWSGLAQRTGAEVINIAGPRRVGTSGGEPEAHEDFSVPPESILPFVPPQQPPPPAPERPEPLRPLLDQLHRAAVDATTRSAAWGILARPAPEGSLDAVIDLRRRARAALLAAPVHELAALTDHPVFLFPEGKVNTGLAAHDAHLPEEEQTLAELGACFGALAAGDDPASCLDAHGFAGGPEGGLRRLVMMAMLYLQGWRLPLLHRPERLPPDLAERYLAWLVASPFLFRKGDDAAYAARAAALLDWFGTQLDRDLPPRLHLALARMATRTDLGNLLLAEAPMEAVFAARNRLLTRLAIATGTPRLRPRAADGREGRIRVGILCRTFLKGPDSEAVAALFQDFDRSRYEIFAYSIGHRDRVVSEDADFARAFDAAIDHRRSLPGDAAGIRARILADDLDVFLQANATTYGIMAQDLALFHPVAPLQAEMNSHLPLPSGYPSFPHFITGEDPPGHAVGAGAGMIALPGPVISYLTSLQRRPGPPPLDRAALGLADEDVVLLNAGALEKLRHDTLLAMMQAAAATPRGVLLLAPYNPGWAGCSRAMSFDRQIAETAALAGLDPARIRVMGELRVAEAEALLSLSDLYLAPFPHGGATMMHLSLIHGLPPVVLRRRSTRSIDQFLLESLGFDELVAETREDYVALAAALGRDAPRRKALAARIHAAAQHPPFVANPDHSRRMQATIDTLLSQKES